MSQTLANEPVRIPSPFSRTGLGILAVMVVAFAAVAAVGDTSCVGTALTEAEITLPTKIG